MYNLRTVMAEIYARTVMAEIYATRRLRFRQLLDERYEWNQSKFARELSLQPSSVSKYVSGARTLGNGVAHRIEHALGLPSGWLDTRDPKKKPITREPFRGGRPAKHA